MFLYGDLNLIQKRHYLVYILLIFAKTECENENHVLWETLELEENFTGNSWWDQVDEGIRHQEYVEKRFACPF